MEFALLKKFVKIAESIENLGDLDFNKNVIMINGGFRNYDIIVTAFKVLEIPFMTFYSKRSIENENEINIKFNKDTEFKVVYALTFLLFEIYYNRLNIYIDYKKLKTNENNKIFLGIYKDRGCVNINISRPIMATEILFFNKEKENWKNIINSNCFKDKFAIENEHEQAIKNCDIYDYCDEEYSEYEGTWAHDVAGLSDDFINDVLDGDPDMFWNID